MLDIKFIRENPEVVKEAARNKNVDVDIDQLLVLDEQVVALRQELDALRQKRNENAESMKGGKPSSEQIEEGKRLKDDISELEAKLSPLEEQLLGLMYKVPNISEPEVPVGATEEENVVVAEFGKKPEFSFKPKNHWELAQAKGWIDKERAAKVAGSRFAYIKGDMFKLQFALVGFTSDRLTDETWLKSVAEKAELNVSTKPFVPVIPPMMVKTKPFKGTGRLSKEEQTYQIDEDELWLNASAEHSICPMYMDEIVAESDLPIRYLGYATSFRKEAGTYGKDMEGILRMHQFDKLEMESFTVRERSKEEHLFLIAIQKELLNELGLHYHFLEKCTADIGTPNAKGVDLETWFPAQNKFRETSSADLMNDFQSRRLNMRVRRTSGELELMHTNDATGIVMSRIPPAILENYQTESGDVVIPEVLRPYMGGRDKI
ncbi:MAG: seryl-tRNA synthetase [Patescibacteria group bacterium]|nr:seryl-tRNA synthetase [Patescibacteria group bacterium]